MIEAIVYDCEIKKMIQGRNEARILGLEYCDGWADHKGMGISCICAYDYIEDRYRVFMADNFDEFKDLVASRPFVIGFNSSTFDNRLCAANDIEIPSAKSWDLLVAIWEGAGLGPTFNYRTHVGYGLDAVAKRNLVGGKTGHGGSMAPALWQRGEYGQLIDYCLNDVVVTKGVLDIALKKGSIFCPKTDGLLRIDTSLLTAQEPIPDWQHKATQTDIEDMT